MTSFYVQNVIGHKYSWNKCSIIIPDKCSKTGAADRSTPQVKLKCIFCSIYLFSVMVKHNLQCDIKVTSLNKINCYLTYTWYFNLSCDILNNCDMSTSACNKVRLVQNYVLYHILNTPRLILFNTFTLKVYHSMFKLKLLLKWPCNWRFSVMRFYR